MFKLDEVLQDTFRNMVSHEVFGNAGAGGQFPQLTSADFVSFVPMAVSLTKFPPGKESRAELIQLGRGVIEN